MRDGENPGVVPASLTRLEWRSKDEGRKHGTHEKKKEWKKKEQVLDNRRR